MVQDANYNVTAIFDNAGNVVERYVYDPFGQVTVLDANWSERAAGSQFGWFYLHQGGRFDAASGLYHFRFRDYSPTLGRWISLDPIRYAAGDVNLYRYVFNGPSILVDPSGYWSWSGAWGGGLTGGGVGAGTGAFIGAPLFGIGAPFGALIGGGVGFVGGFIVGGIWGEDATSWALNRPPEKLSTIEVFIGGGVLGVPAGLVGGILGPAGWSYAIGALPSAPITFYFTAYGGTGFFWMKYAEWYRVNFGGNPDPRWFHAWKIMQFFPPNTPTEGMFP